MGSSTSWYRLEAQPHVVDNVLIPLGERGITMVHLDIKAEPGVDVVCDITNPGFEPAAVLGREFDLVLCNNTLVHVAVVDRAVASLRRLPAPGGLLLVSTPEAYRKVRDPLDNGLRPSPDELADLLTRGGGYEVLETASVRVDERGSYRGWFDRPARHLVAGRWLPVPSFVEALRYRSRRLRWRVSCVLLRRTA